MSLPFAPEHADTLADQAARSADHAIRSTQRLGNEALDGLASTVEGLRSQAAPLLHDAAGQADALLQRGLGTVHEQSQQLRAAARSTSDSIVGYIRHDPLKAVLIAAASGAVLVSLIGLMRGSRPRG